MAKAIAVASMPARAAASRDVAPIISAQFPTVRDVALLRKATTKTCTVVRASASARQANVPTAVTRRVKQKAAPNAVKSPPCPRDASASSSEVARHPALRGERPPRLRLGRHVEMAGLGLHEACHVPLSAAPDRHRRARPVAQLDAAARARTAILRD